MTPTNLTLEQMVTANPAAAEVLERFQLDFCCHGQRSLAEACAADGVDSGRVQDELARSGADRPCGWSWADASTEEIVEHILDRYHAPLRRDLPVLVALARQVEEVHAGKATSPAGLAAHLERVAASVESHLAKEEGILFPLIRASRGRAAYMPIKVMMQEHEDHATNLARTRALAHDFAPPPDACSSWHELYLGLAGLEVDLHRHIHLENYVLFPRVLGMDAGS